MFILLYAVVNVHRRISPASGDGEIRTHDPLLARQVLSQLSYTPKCILNVKLKTHLSQINMKLDQTC